MNVHGWNFYWHEAFKIIFENLLSEVERIADKDPDNFDQHPTYKLYDAIESAIFDRIAVNPDAKEFRMGDTLREKRLKHWRRVKHGMPNRHRMFFQFNTSNSAIILGWLNDSRTLRKQGAKTDAYTVFKKLVLSGNIPNSFDEIFEQCKPADIKRSS